MLRESMGYPSTECKLCECLGACKPQIEPYFQQGNELRFMIVGQDPAIYDKPNRVKVVLMLDQPNSQLSRWLRGMISKDKFDKLTLYATNTVKCLLNKPPSSDKKDGLKILRPYFKNCKRYLIEEITLFKPDYLITLGEPAHILFLDICQEKKMIKRSMKDAFTGDFINVNVNGTKFKYSPCLHISTYRVADTYGKRIDLYKEQLSAIVNTEKKVY